MLTPLHKLLCRSHFLDTPVCHGDDEMQSLSWRALADAVTLRAAAFSQRSELRGLLIENDPCKFIVELFALLHAGKHVVIPSNTQPGTLAQLSGEFDFVATTSSSSTTSSASDDSIAGTSSSSAARATVPALQPFDPAKAIINLYTSGSTGTPKCVRKYLTQFEAEIEVQETLWGALIGDSTVVSTVPHHHIYGLLFRLLWPLSAGRVFDAVTCIDPNTLKQRLQRFGSTVLVSSPAQLARLPQLISLTSLKPTPNIIFSSGGPLPLLAATEFQRQLNQTPVEIFGSTETGGIAWRRQTASDMWTPLPQVEVDRDEDGALLLRSPFLNDDQPFCMSDAIELCEGGRFRLKGRLDRIVKIEEKRLSLPEMEHQLSSHPWIAAATAIVLNGKRQRIGAVVVLNAAGQQQLAVLGRRNTIQQLRHHLSAHFEILLLPRHWRFIDELPLNKNGKLTYGAIAALFAPREKHHAAS